MLKAYMCCSRVRTADSLLVVQPYSQWLFKQGEMRGPHLLMELWRGNLKEQELQERREADQQGNLQWNDVADMTYPCWHCSEKAGKEVLRPLKDFQVRESNFWRQCVVKGAGACCRRFAPSMKKTRRPPPQAAGRPPSRAPRASLRSPSLCSTPTSWWNGA